MNKRYVIVYPPGSYEPKIIEVDTDIYPLVSKICKGYEAVRIPRLYQIMRGAVFICCDDFNHLLDPQDRGINYVGTYLYGCDWQILGSICIVKEQYDPDGITHVGFPLSEANYICDEIKKGSDYYDL